MTGSLIDPFAKDVFAVSPEFLSDSEIHVDNKGVKTSTISPSIFVSWAKNLKQVTKNEAHSSSSIPTLPLTFNVHLLQTLRPCIANYTHTSLDEISLTVHDFCEINTPVSKTPLNSNLYVLLAIGSQSIPFVFVFENTFVISLVDQILGGSDNLSGTLRTLSITEISVLEFFLLNLISAINDSYQSSLLRLVSFDLLGLSDANWSRYLSTTVAVDFKKNTGTILIWSTAEVLKIFSQEYHLLLESSPLTLKLPVNLPRSVFAHMERIAPEISLSVQIGKTEILLGNLRQLEPEDIFIIQEIQIDFNNGHFEGNLRIRVGNGQVTTIAGKVVTNLDEKRRTQVLVEQITSGEEPLDTEELEISESRQSPAEGSAVLDGLLLTIHIEIGARRIRLDELACLRIGQILSLGCTASDPVDLTCDGRRIARGELVDIQGHLGVRISQLLT